MKSVEDLLDTVRQLTEAGRLRWVQTAFPPEDRFQSDLPNNLTLSAAQWLDGISETANVSVELRHGPEILDSIRADEFEMKFHRLADFFEVARRSAKGVDEVVGGVLAELEKLKND